MILFVASATFACWVTVAVQDAEDVTDEALVYSLFNDALKDAVLVMVALRASPVVLSLFVIVTFSDEAFAEVRVA